MATDDDSSFDPRAIAAYFQAINEPWRWTFEYAGADGDLYTENGCPDIVAARLQQFNATRSCCSLGDDRDGSQIWCWGEPERRVVEVRRVGSQPRCGVVARAGAVQVDIAEVRMMDDGPRVIQVSADLVLTPAECIALFNSFREEGHPLPCGYVVRPKSYYSS